MLLVWSRVLSSREASGRKVASVPNPKLPKAALGHLVCSASSGFFYLALFFALLVDLPAFENPRWTGRGTRAQEDSPIELEVSLGLQATFPVSALG